METKPAQDLATLTSLRFFAALMIFVYHIYSWNFTPYAWAKAIAPGMFHGVSFFFVLSGFVLTHAYLGRDVSVAQFYRARIARIVPLHIACILLMLALLPLPFARNMVLSPDASAATFALKLTLLDAWVPNRATLMGWNSVSWSLSVEMAFYAIFPWLLAAMSRRPALTLALMCLLSSATFVAGLALPVDAKDSGQFAQLYLFGNSPPARVWEFALGMASYFVWRRHVAPLQLSRGRWTALEGACLGLVAVWLGFVVPAMVHAAEGVWFVALRSSSSAWIFAALIVLMASGRGAFGRALSQKALVSLGQASFAFYLCHGIVLRTLDHYAKPNSAVLALGLSLALAFALHHYVEAPLRRRLMATTPRVSPLSAAR